MLLNEFLKEHRKVEEQGRKIESGKRKGQERDATINLLKSARAQQQKEIKALSAGLQKVSDRLNKPASQLVADKSIKRQPNRQPHFTISPELRMLSRAGAFGAFCFASSLFLPRVGRLILTTIGANDQSAASNSSSRHTANSKSNGRRLPASRRQWRRRPRRSRR